MAVLKESSSNVQSNRPAGDKDNSASRNDRQTTVLDKVDSLTVSRNLDMQNSFDQDSGAKWSDTESTASSETSSGSSSPSTYHPRYRRIPSQASSISLSVPSAESSAFPSRATSLTNISIVSDELSLGPPVENESSLTGLGVQNLDPSFTDPAKTFGIQFEEQAPRSGSSDESEPSSVQAKATADEDTHECLTDVEQQGNVNSEEQGGSVDVEETQPEEQEKDDDPWNSIPNFGTSNRKKWSDLTTCGKIKRVLLDYICKPLAAFTCLYFFIVALDLMGDAFTLIGGSAAGAALSDSTLLENPIVGLMIGMLVTVLLQSSSGTTSIIVSMVAADIIQVQEAIPMVMGANLGTSVTNTIVAGGQAGDRETFRLSFAGATVHDCFNWLAVLILLPLECVSGYLYHLTSAIVDSSNLHQISGTNKMSITSPIVDLIIQLDMSVLEKVALGELEPGEESLVDRWCIVGAEYNGTVFYEYDELVADYYADYNTTATVITDRCNFLFAYCDLPDEVIGAIIWCSL
ncbi:sodium-dependent phosphate transport protein 2A-like [Ptychodera flava]|uniref:sodium-dependent phosphate transport protein 2A-like n=1 Tax=Ptychodera flava TaxID=63121 RepID=UPI003969EAC2